MDGKIWRVSTPTRSPVAQFDQERFGQLQPTTWDPSRMLQGLSSRPRLKAQGEDYYWWLHRNGYSLHRIRWVPTLHESELTLQLHRTDPVLLSAVHQRPRKRICSSNGSVWRWGQEAFDHLAPWDLTTIAQFWVIVALTHAEFLFMCPLLIKIQEFLYIVIHHHPPSSTHGFC